MNFLLYLIDFIFSCITILMIVRAWMQLARVDYYNPFSQFIARITHPIINPLTYLIPSKGAFNFSSIIIAYLSIVIKIILLFFLFSPSDIPFAMIFIGSILVLIKSIGKVIFWILILRAILSWISQGRYPVEYIFFQMTEPFLSKIRRLLPNTGGLDFSVMIALFILYGLNYLGLDLSSTFGLSGYWTS